MNKPSCLQEDIVEEIYVRSNNGVKLSTVLHRPETTSSSPTPIVVIFHGMGANKAGTGDSHIKLARRLAGNGICCLRFDFRGSGESEGSISESSFMDFVKDGSAVIESLRDIPGIDSQSVAIYGSSLGGTVSIFVAELHADNIRSIALWAPITNGSLWIKEILAVPDSERSQLKINRERTQALYKGVAISKNFENEFSTVNLAERLLHIPTDIHILHLQGTNDDLVSLKHRDEIVKTLEVKGFSYDTRLYTGFGHSLGNQPEYDAVLDELTSWFIGTLKRS
ncbi:MAG: alpha/beta hydrolase [Victivallaceae bacterium]